MADVKRIQGKSRRVVKWNDEPSAVRPKPHSAPAPKARTRRAQRRDMTGALQTLVAIAFVVALVVLSISAIDLKRSSDDLDRLEARYEQLSDELDAAQVAMKMATDSERIRDLARTIGMVNDEAQLQRVSVSLPARTQGTLAAN